MTAHDAAMKSVEHGAPGHWLGRCDLESTIPWCVALVLLLGLGTAATLLGPINHDVGVGLYEATRVFDGARMYVDLVDNNPPLWVWVSLPAVLLSRMTGWSDIVLLQLGQVLLVLLSVFASYRVLSAAAIFSSVRMRRLFVLGVGVFLFAGAGVDLGQRDWIMIALFTPYVLLSAGRAMQKGVPPSLAVVIGIAAAVGVALKPFFLLPWLAVEIYLTFFCRVGWPWRRIESVCLVGGHVLYVALVLLLTPEFLGSLKLTAKVYSAYNCTTQQFLIDTIHHTPLALAAIVLFVFFRPRAEDRQLRRVLLIATLGLVGAAFVQHKGWSYHLFPSAMAGGLLLLAMLASLCRDAPATDEIFRPRGSALALLFLGAMAVASGRGLYAASQLHQEWTSDPEAFSGLVTLLKENAHGRPVVILSSLVSPMFPTVNYAHLSYGTRYACLWLLPGIYKDAAPLANGKVYHVRADMDEVERSVFDGEIEDLLKSRPGIVMVDTTPKKEAFGTTEFDYIEYFSRDERFAAFWKDYHFLAIFGYQAIFVRNPPGARTGGGSRMY